MTLEASVIREGCVRSVQDGYEVDVHLAWYRSLPLSCVEGAEVELGDRIFQAADIRVKNNNQWLTFEQMGELTNQYWYTLDALTLKLACESPAQAGESALLKVSLSTRIPYIIIGPNMPLVQRTDVAKEVTVQ